MLPVSSQDAFHGLPATVGWERKERPVRPALDFVAGAYKPCERGERGVHTAQNPSFIHSKHQKVRTDKYFLWIESKKTPGQLWPARCLKGSAYRLLIRRATSSQVKTFGVTHEKHCRLRQPCQVFTIHTVGHYVPCQRLEHATHCPLAPLCRIKKHISRQVLTNEQDSVILGVRMLTVITQGGEVGGGSNIGKAFYRCVHFSPPWR